MEADALSRGAATQGPRSPAEAPIPAAYAVVIHKGPTWSLSDIEPYCRMLSGRFEGEVWAFGSYDAEAVIGRMRLRVIAGHSGRTMANRLRFARHTLRWIEALRRARPSNLVFITLDPLWSGVLGLYAAWRTGAPLICEINGAYASPHNTANSRSSIGRLLRIAMRRGVGRFVLRRTAGVRLLYPDQLRGFARVPSSTVVRRFFETTRLDLFHPGPQEPLILGVGFPFRVKGFDVLCRAFLEIADRHPRWKLVLIGYRAPEEVLEGGFAHPRIEAYPGVQQTEVAEWMSRCAIFALPSRTEAMGRVLLEAGAAGTCRVAARVDGIPTVVEDGVDGLLVESQNVEQLASVLERAMEDEALRRRLGEAAMRRVEREFSAQAYLEHYGELVTATLERSRA